MPYPGSLRVRWEAKTDSGNTGKVDVEGFAGKCDQFNTTSTTYKAQSCVLPVIAGDRITVTAKGTFTGMAIKQTYIRNVQLMFGIRDSNGIGSVEQD